MIPRILFALPAWLLYTALMVPLILIGAVLVPILALGGPLTMTLRPSQKYPGRTVLAWAWRWMWIFSNEEDGLDGTANCFWPPAPTYLKRAWQIIRWSAWRNNVGNARWLPFFGITVNPAKVKVYPQPFNFKEGPFIARQGWCSEVKFCWNPKQPDWTKRRYCWIGWRMAQQTQVTHGVGFAVHAWYSL